MTKKVHIVKATVFLAVMYRCENWTIKNAEHQRINAFELWCWRRLEILLVCKEIVSVNPKGNESWICIGRTDDEAPSLWPPVAKSWAMGKDFGDGKNWRQKEKGAAEDEMVREHHWLNGHEFKQTLGDSEGQRRLACCSPWGSQRGRPNLVTE